MFSVYLIYEENSELLGESVPYNLGCQSHGKYAFEFLFVCVLPLLFCLGFVYVFSMF